MPGSGLTIWYMEDGFQTRVAPGLSRDYAGRESDQWALDPVTHEGRTAAARRRADDQATQLADALRLAYCQPYVGAFFNFLLADERGLGGLAVGPAVVELAAEAVVPCLRPRRRGHPPRLGRLRRLRRDGLIRPARPRG